MYVKWVKSAQLGEDATPDILNYYCTDTAPLDPLAIYSVQVYAMYNVCFHIATLLSLWMRDMWHVGGGGVQADPAQRHGAVLLEQWHHQQGMIWMVAVD